VVAHAPLGASVSQRLVTAITGPSVVVTVLSIVSALVVGAVVVALSTDLPALTAVERAYRALLRGSLGGVGQISETLVAATPLIATGLAVAIPLRAGLFNIGAEGQVIAGGLIAGLVGFSLSGLPMLVHLPLAVLAGLAGGALLGWLPGILKARTGAHEVISTIMLNNTMLAVTTYLLSTELYRQPGRADPISQSMEQAARFPRFPGMTQYRVNLSIVLVLLLAIAVFWLLERSTTGFELGAVGSNPHAATSAGMDPRRAIIIAMALGGALAGAAGGSEILGIQHRVTDGFSAGIGFDGITVALLGRGGVGGTVMAGLLFGALKSGGRAMQAQTGTSLDLVVVIQAIIIVFIAAPGLVRAIYRIRAEGAGTGQIAKGWGS
jgi:simple sugar transport system permease protein